MRLCRVDVVGLNIGSSSGGRDRFFECGGDDRGDDEGGMGRLETRLSLSPPYHARQRVRTDFSSSHQSEDLGIIISRKRYKNKLDR